MITALVILLLMLFVAIRFSKKYRRIRHQQWRVRDWLERIKTKLINIKNKKPRFSLLFHIVKKNQVIQSGNHGLIKTAVMPKNEEIHWYCPDCEVDGLISGWQKTKWDNR